MKQMAKLAQAIVHGPELVVLDEPTNGLDPAARRRMLKLVADMKEEQGMNVLSAPICCATSSRCATRP